MASVVAALAAEFIGTFMLVFTVGCTSLAHVSDAWAPTAVACVLMVGVYAFSGVSGGHLNPAVTLAVGLANKFDGICSNWPMVFAYMSIQVASGIAAGTAFWLLFKDQLVIEPMEGFSWWEAMIVETVFTAMLAFVVLSTACSKRNNPHDNPNQFYGLAIGFVIVAAGYAGGPVSGGAFNPAVAIGVEASLSTSHGVYWGFTYSCYEAIGALIAAALFRLTRPEDYTDEAELALYEPTLPTKLASEFLGTFMLVLTVGLNVLSGSVSTAWSAAASLMCMIYSLGDVSGGHFNPAVTLAVVCSRKGGCSPQQGCAYVVIQVLAAVFAGFLYAGIYHSHTVGLAPKAPYTAKAAYVMEFLFTFVLAFVVLSTACVKGISSQLTRNYYFAFAIGACVTAGGFASGVVSGGALNPAVAFGIAIPNTINHGEMFYCMTYSLVELTGGLFAAAMFHVTHAKEYKGDRALFAASEQ